MIDRDGPGAKFIDFDMNDLDRYQAKLKTLDAEPDFETTKSGVAYTLENTQQQFEAADAPPTDWRTNALAKRTLEEKRRLLVELREMVGMSPETV